MKLKTKMPLSGLCNALGAAGFLALWWAISYFMANPTLLPPPTKVVQALLDNLSSGVLLPHVLASLFRILAGFLMALAVALPLGLLMGLSRRIEDFVDPFVELFRPIPPYAWIPMAILWFGVSQLGPVFITFIAAFFPIILSVTACVKSVDPNLLNAARTLGASRGFAVYKIIVPAMLPQIMPGIRLSFGAAWLALLAAELVASQSGLGFLISDARELLQTSTVIMGMGVIGLIGFAFNKLFFAIERRTSRYWRTIS